MVRALLAIVGVILFGTVGLMWIEGWDFWRSIFFTLITITTVGYSDYGLTESGERFTAILLLGGIGVATYSVGQFIQAFIDRQLGREQKTMRQIGHLKDHYIICGLGRIGTAVCQQLARENVPLVAVDHRDEAVEAATRAGHIAIAGDATDDETLERLGIARAQGIACLTDSDTVNIVITLSARELSPDISIISRAEDDDSVRKIRRAGATRIISPLRAGGLRIADTILKPHLADLLDRSHDSDTSIELAEITVESSSGLDGASIRDFGVRHPSLVFVAVKPVGGSPVLRPRVDRSLRSGDVLIVAGDTDSLAALHQSARPQAQAA